MTNMYVLYGITNFNGKTVTLVDNTLHGEPPSWYLVFDNGTTLHVNEAMPDYRKQVDALSFLLSDALSDTSYKNKAITDIFDANWAGSGSEDDVVRLSLEYVGYNAENVLSDKAGMELMHTELATKAEELAKFVTNSISNLLFVGQKLDEVISKLEGCLAKVDVALNEARLFSQDKEIEIAFRQARIDVFARLQAGESVGVGWTNATFWRDFGNTVSGKRVADILGRTNLK